MRFVRYTRNPVIPRTPGTFYSVFSANADVLEFRGELFLYFRGQAEDGHDRIGVGRAAVTRFDGATWDILPHPIVPLGERVEDHDSKHSLDPAAVVLNGKVFLYYTAYSSQSGRAGSIGLAVSEDGMRFERTRRPVASGLAPEAVVHEGAIFLFYHRMIPGAGMRLYRVVSTDGENFSEAGETEVFAPSGHEGSFDNYSIVTCRIWREGSFYYLIYGGSPWFADYPEAIGLARSTDLQRWERYPENPVFTRGEPGEWDEGALWFPTVHRVGNVLYMWYEGGGAGLGLGTPEAREASRLCREKEYGGYGRTTFSQIGLATFEGRIPEW